MQNEIIQICGQIVKMNKSQSLSILADETTDVAGIEQLSLSDRYFDKEKKTNCGRILNIYPSLYMMLMLLGKGKLIRYYKPLKVYH